jgi:hypothetical protein
VLLNTLRANRYTQNSTPEKQHERREGIQTPLRVPFGAVKGRYHKDAGAQTLVIWALQRREHCLKIVVRDAALRCDLYKMRSVWVYCTNGHAVAMLVSALPNSLVSAIMKHAVTYSLQGMKPKII